jgi:hypothetical protein
MILAILSLSPTIPFAKMALFRLSQTAHQNHIQAHFLYAELTMTLCVSIYKNISKDESRPSLLFTGVMLFF